MIWKPEGVFFPPSFLCLLANCRINIFFPNLKSPVFLFVFSPTLLYDFFFFFLNRPCRSSFSILGEWNLSKQMKHNVTLLAFMKTTKTVSLCLWSWSSYPAVNRYSSSSLSSQASNEVSNITGQSESSDEVFNMQVGLLHSKHFVHTP